MLDRIRIVLVNTSHPGNIGSVARAMKTMGLSQLYLVDPLQFPHAKAEELASGATDVLGKAKVLARLDEAIADCSLVVGTSARSRKIPWPLLSPKALADKIRQEPVDSQVAIVFGREDSGLSNDELQRCHIHLQIPANPEYSSLNIASAVQVVAYELHVASLHGADENTWDYRLANAEEMEKFFVHLQQMLIEIDFLKMSAPRQLMTRLRRFFFRARPDVMEMNILRGMMKAVQDKLNPKR